MKPEVSEKHRHMKRKSIRSSRGLLNDAPFVRTVNTGGGRGNLAVPVGNYSICAHELLGYDL